MQYYNLNIEDGTYILTNDRNRVLRVYLHHVSINYLLSNLRTGVRRASGYFEGALSYENYKTEKMVFDINEYNFSNIKNYYRELFVLKHILKLDKICFVTPFEADYFKGHLVKSSIYNLEEGGSRYSTKDYYVNREDKLCFILYSRELKENYFFN